jgi:uncharacterized protein (DUF433 family)
MQGTVGTVGPKYRIRATGGEGRIIIDPEIRSGKPCIKGTRITVYDVLEHLTGGMSEDQILEDFPELSREEPPRGTRLCCGA